MTRQRKTGAHAQRGPNGAFTSTQAPSAAAEHNSDDDGPDDDPLAWESVSDDSSDESEPQEYWAQLPKPMTWEERMKKRAIQKEKAEKKCRITEMRSAEHRLADLCPSRKNGPYSIGGMSVRTASGKRKTLKDDYENGRLAISEVEFNRQMGYLQARKPEPGKQLTLGNMFKKRPRAVSSSSDEVEISSGPAPTKRLKGDSASSSAAAVELREEEESSSGSESETGKSDLDDNEEQHPELLEQEARSKEGDVAVDSIIFADEIAEWVETVLEDAAPLHPSELASLAADGLKKARKSKDYRSTILFAALADFYGWMPRMGRLAAALRVAKNHGRGPAFQRVLCAQARFFEANGALKLSHQGRRQKQNGILDEEGFYMGLQRWLRTLAAGTINPKLLQQHVNETLFPALSFKKKTISVRQCQRWLWKLSYRRKTHQKGVYWDRHERKDVKKRRKEYLAELEAADPFRPRYAEPDMAEICREAEDDELEHIFIVHDESTIHSNDYQNNHYWLQPNEQVATASSTLPEEMVAANEALVAELRLAFTKSTTVIYPDNKPGGDAYWNMEQMIAQLAKAILIARRMFPKAIIHWVFDNFDEEEERPVDCCMRRLLSRQPDFAGEKSQLELLIEAVPGMFCHFLPKFQPEMNPIEYFWAWIKHYFRERSNGQWKKAQKLVTEALAACPPLPFEDSSAAPIDMRVFTATA
ncbi:hypothetical protein B0H17DRAFT_1340407, partial [Mycena rosella]